MSTIGALGLALSCAQEEPVRIAWLGATPDNLYDEANLQGAQQAALAANAEVEPFYSQFDPAMQLAQCHEVVVSGEFDALVVLAASAEGIVPCVDEAAAAGLPVVATDLPIGPDPTTAEPQVPGQVGAVLTPASGFGEALDELVLARCAGLDPCRVVYIGAYLELIFDAITLDALDAFVAAHPEVQIVAKEEAFYDQATAQTIMQELLADDPDIDLVIAAGDQMAQGAEAAIVAAGVPAGEIAIIGGGAGSYGVTAVKEGRWYATFITLPYDEGKIAAEIAIDAARGEPIADPGVNPVELRGLPPFLSADNLAEFADFEPQWPG